MQNKELIKTIQKRQTIYAFLKRIYEKELPKEFLAEMPGKLKPLNGLADALPAKSKQAVKELVQFADSISSKNLDDTVLKLAADYARLFLSIHKVPPHPSESVYREGAMMQFYRDEVLKTYWSFGVDKVKEFTEPEDHIAVELGFMMFLCDKAAGALKKGDSKDAEKYIQAQKDFLENHLAKWVPKLVKDVVENARTPFYKGVAVLTQECIDMDVPATADILKQLKS
ncbi:MAG: molecular chaperone TorD family protein [Dehalococcoidia bacterium]|nr:molecular chaperone TorD family protein [Dehalococcoidia bacterium]